MREEDILKKLKEYVELGKVETTDELKTIFKFIGWLFNWYGGEE